MRRIAFDLDETLGVPRIDGNNIVGWNFRDGCAELLTTLQNDFTLCLWSVSSRRYVNLALSFGLNQWFADSYSWDEVATSWKDISQIDVDFLIDDSPHHRETAVLYGLGDAYIVIPAYGSPDDVADPFAWVRLVESRLLQSRPVP